MCYVFCKKQIDMYLWIAFKWNRLSELIATSEINLFNVDNLAQNKKYYSEESGIQMNIVWVTLIFLYIQKYIILLWGVLKKFQFPSCKTHCILVTNFPCFLVNLKYCFSFITTQNGPDRYSSKCIMERMFPLWVHCIATEDFLCIHFLYCSTFQGFFSFFDVGPP